VYRPSRQSCRFPPIDYISIVQSVVTLYPQIRNSHRQVGMDARILNIPPHTLQERRNLIWRPPRMLHHFHTKTVNPNEQILLPIRRHALEICAFRPRTCRPVKFLLNNILESNLFHPLLIMLGICPRSSRFLGASYNDFVPFVQVGRNRRWSDVLKWEGPVLELEISAWGERGEGLLQD